MYQIMYGRPSKRMRRIKPVARVGAVDINVRYDIYGRQSLKDGSCSDECYDILEGEVLYAITGANYYRNNSLHLLSCVNGLDAKKKWKVCGVAVTGFSPKVDVYEQGFVLQVSGLTTIFNNMTTSISPGEDVYVTLPGDKSTNQNPQGVPHAKKILQLTKGGPKAQLLGTCVKGGRPGTSIDIVLHRSGSRFKPLKNDSSAESSKSDGQSSEPVLSEEEMAELAAQKEGQKTPNGNTSRRKKRVK